MAWTSHTVAQNGNSTVTWTAQGYWGMSRHDAVVAGIIGQTTSTLRVEHVSTRLNPLRTSVRVRVIGAQAVSFRLYAEQMN